MLRKLLKSALSLLCLGIFVSSAFAQSGTIKGKLTDSKTNEPLPGANVLVVELNKGAATDADGSFMIDNVPAGTYTLRATFVGYQTTNVTVDVSSGTVTKNIALQPSTVGLEDVVVTAFGVQREERSLGYSSQSVKTDEMAKNPESNFVNSLQGKVAGVQITNSSGAVGGSSRIVLRGVSSLTGNNQPLFIVDGVYIDNSTLNPAGEFDDRADYGNAAMDINPQDIKSITVLKGPNAAALYGSRASNGAIVIETKDGAGAQKEGIGVSVNSTVTFSDPLILPDFQNQFGQGGISYTGPVDADGNATEPNNPDYYKAQFQYVDGAGGGINDGTDESWGPALDGTPRVQWWTNGEKQPWVAHPDNVKNYFDTGVNLTNNVAVSGNYDQANFRLSMTNTQNNGVLPNSSLQRNNVTLSAGAQLSDNLHANGRVSYIQNISDNLPDQGYSSENPMQQLTQWFGRQVDMAKLRDYKNADGSPRNWNYNYHDNPFWEQYMNGNHQQRDRVIGNVNLTYDITDWLSIKGMTGNDWYQDRRRNWRAVQTINDPDGYYSEDVYYINNWTSNLIASINRDFSEDVSFDGRVGMENRQRTFERNFSDAPSLSIPGVYSLENSAVRQGITDRTTKKEVNSVFGSATFGYKDFVYLDLTGRNDWSSTLPTNNNSYFYPSASLSFIFTDAFDLNADWLTYGKLRAGWTRVGNDTDPYQLQQTFTATDPFNGIPTYTVANQIPNTNLKPEQTESWEYGAELRFLNNRLGLNATYYTQTTTDQILPVQISRASGFDSKIVNAGKVENKGIELTLNATPVQTRDFQWDLTFNYARNQNKVISLAEDLDTYVIGSSWDITVEARPGEEFGTLRGYGYLRDDNGNIVVDDRGIPETDYSGKKNFGSYAPDWTGSVSSQFNYKNLGLSFLIDTKQGGKLSSVTYMFGRGTGILEETLAGRDGSTFVFDGVKEDGTPNDIPINMSSVYDYNWSYFGNAESHIFDASYIKLREVRLSYSLPARLLRNLPIRNLDVALVGRNLWIIDKNVPHIDPETAFSNGNLQGLESNQIPSTRSFGFNVSFSL